MLLAVLLAGCAPPAPLLAPAPIEVALTFDDLPYQTAAGGASIGDPVRQEAVSAAMIGALRSHDAVATVFVNCGNLVDASTLEAWRTAGHAIGNHTAHHLSAERTETAAWLADVRACDDLWAADDPSPRWFRFPYLRRGQTADVRDAALRGLAEAGYRVAPVTADTVDWYLSQRYDAALASAAPTAELADAYVERLVASVREGDAAARDKLGRSIPLVVLLHVHQLAADHLDRALTGLDAAGIRVVSLETAMADPVYAAPDVFEGRGSRLWLARTAPLLRPDGSEWYVDAESALYARFPE